MKVHYDGLGRLDSEEWWLCEIDGWEVKGLGKVDGEELVLSAKYHIAFSYCVQIYDVGDRRGGGYKISPFLD